MKGLWILLVCLALIIAGCCAASSQQKTANPSTSQQAKAPQQADTTPPPTHADSPVGVETAPSAPPKTQNVQVATPPPAAIQLPPAQSAKDLLKATYIEKCPLTATCGKISNEAMRNACFRPENMARKDWLCCVYKDDTVKERVSLSFVLADAQNTKLKQIGFDSSTLMATAAEECVLNGSSITSNYIGAATSENCEFMSDPNLRDYCYYKIATLSGHFFREPSVCEKIVATDMRDLCLMTVSSN